MYFSKEMRRCWQFSLNAFLVKLSKYKYEYKMNKNENNISAWIQGKVHLLTIDTTRVVLPYTSGKRLRFRLFDSEIWRSFPYNNWHCEGAKERKCCSGEQCVAQAACFIWYSTVLLEMSSKGRICRFLSFILNLTIQA